MSRPLSIALGLSVALSITPSLSSQTYKTIGQYKLSAAAKGVAVDSAGRRIFVAGGDGVQALDADSGASLGVIGELKNAQDVLLIPVMNGDERTPSRRGFASDDQGEVILFSLTDLKQISSVKLQTPGRSTLCYDGDSKTVEAVSTGGSLTTIDAETGKVVKAGKIETGTGQITCGNMAHVYVADPAANVVHVLNHETMKNDGDYPMKTGHHPTGLALDTKGRRLFASCEDGVIEIIDTDAGFTFIELAGGTGVAHETFAWSPQGKGQWKAAAFIAQADGTVSGVRMNAYINYSMGGQYKLAADLGAVAYDEKTHHLFVIATQSGMPVVLVVGY